MITKFVFTYRRARTWSNKQARVLWDSQLLSFLFPFGRRGKFSGKFLIITESLVAIIYIGNH